MKSQTESNLVKLRPYLKSLNVNSVKSIKQQIWMEDTHNLKGGIWILSKRGWIWGVSWYDNNGYLAMFNSWYFENLISKSILSQYENIVQCVYFAIWPRFKWFEDDNNLFEGLKVGKKCWNNPTLGMFSKVWNYSENGQIWSQIKWHRMWYLWMKSTKMETRISMLHSGTIFTHEKWWEAI